MSDTFWVFGATGYVGSALVRALLTRHLPCVAHLRADAASSRERADAFTSQGAVAEISDFSQEALLHAFSRHPPRAVLICIGTTRARMKSQPTGSSYDAVDFGLTAAIAHAARAFSPEVRLVYLSALGASSRSANDYLRARGKAEEAVAQSGLPFAILRPAVITGPDRPESRTGERLAASLGDAALSLVNHLGLRSLSQAYHSASADEVAAILLDMACSPTPLNATRSIGDVRTPSSPT